MKKNYLSILLGIIVLLSCTKTPVNLSQFSNSKKTNTSYDRSIEEMKSIAIESVDFFSKRISTRGENSAYRIKDIIPVKSLETRAKSEKTDIYVVNFYEDAGFVLVGGKKYLPEIIAFVEGGNYDGSFSQVPGFNIFMNEISNSIKTLKCDNKEDDLQIQDFYYDIKSYIDTLSISKLVNTEWHQRYPFNMFCFTPDGISAPAGCVAIAMAQIMSKHSFPHEIKLTYPNADSIMTELDWSNMTLPLHTYNHNVVCKYCIQNGRLCREIGKHVGMEYGGFNSGASSENVKAAFESFGYVSSPYVDYHLTNIIESLKNGNPVYIRARNENSGHAWVTDGYKYIKKYEEHYKVDFKENTRELVGGTTTIERFLHFNYGWGGEYNGYYLAYHEAYGSSPIINNGSYQDPVITIFEGKHGLNKDVKIIYDIKPNK